jgi:hypothetical protein
MGPRVPVQQLNERSLGSFKSLFATLDPPTLTGMEGIHQSEFIGPLWLRKLSGLALHLGGLGGWWGKKFDALGHGSNIVYRRGQLSLVMPIELAEMPSLLDGHSGLTVVYPPNSPFPWPRIVDELRQLEENCLLGMTMVKSRSLNGLAFPFLLHKRDNTYGL